MKIFDEHIKQLEKYENQLRKMQENLSNIGCGLWDLLDELAENCCISRDNADFVSDKLPPAFKDINEVADIIKKIISENEDEEE